MKRFILIVLALALCTYGWRQIAGYAWTPATAPKWNPLALKESGFGRTLARVLTEQANSSFHHGLLERPPPINTNPLSVWIDAGTIALGFQGRLHYRPIEKYPLHPYEVSQALEQVEKNLRLAFELDPGNYTAYDIYLYFLTTKVTQTEFASLSGAQLQDEDDDKTAKQGDKIQENGSQASAPIDTNSKDPQPQAGVYQHWTEQERERRHARAIEITDEAIRKFRPNTMDPERFVTAAVMWYNRFMLLAPDPEERQKSVAARQKFEEVGPLTFSKMTYYLEAAKTCQDDLEQKGLWKAIPERRAEYLEAVQLIQKCAFALSVALQNNRAQLAQDRQGPKVWGPLGKN